MTTLYKISLVLVTILFLGACANQPPQVSHDGLVLQEDRRFQEVYLLPGAELSAYTEVGLAPCSVAFRKHWLRDQNNRRLDLSSRVTQEDVDRIKDALGGECEAYFREALLEEPAYTLVDSFDKGEAVLVLRPAIINLDINAPDVMGPGRSQTYTTSAGEMTLALELLDGTTGQVLARVLDRRRAPDMQRLQWTNGITNKADADRALKRWAKLFRESLDTAMGR